MKKKVNNTICRCEEISEQEIRDAIRKFNLRTVDAVKRLTRAGMGLCQGRTCTPLLTKIIAEETDKKVDELLPLSKRPPVRPVKVEFLAREGEQKLD
ncbi:(2Fe-2S)-binding protein [Candidatus Aerophobetes bacterium Ae_b3a]|nr:MAG: (2Fe-2S)-binding protein [Candidatus Aerophobetes bacterium Ae_b3a]